MRPEEIKPGLRVRRNNQSLGDMSPYFVNQVGTIQSRGVNSFILRYDCEIQGAHVWSYGLDKADAFDRLALSTEEEQRQEDARREQEEDLKRRQAHADKWL